MKVEITTAEPTKGTQNVTQPELNIEELEERTAPGHNLNHNETLMRDEEDPKGQFLADQSDLNIEELEEKIAPGKNLNHNQTFVTDAIDIDRD